MIMAAGLRATAKAVDHPPEPKIGAPVLDPIKVEEAAGRGPEGIKAMGPVRSGRTACRS